MVSENNMSSLSAYSAAIALALPIVAIAFGDRGWNLLKSGTRVARTTIRPSEGKCIKREWAALADGYLHACSTPGSAQCHHSPHMKSPRCFEQSFELVLNRWKPTAGLTIEGKPPPLPLTKDFVQVDFKMVIAYVLMTDDVSMNIQTIKPELLVLHSTSQLQRVLTKDYVDRLLEPIHGYPPLLTDPKGVTIQKFDDQKRGGWVAAIGLDTTYDQSMTFLPFYYDCVTYVDNTFGDKRGRVFWRSMDRVRDILENMFVASFEPDASARQDIDCAIRALNWIRQKETDSGVEKFFLIANPRAPLQQSDKVKIIALFNGEPLLATRRESQFRTEWAHLLHYVLVAAVTGSARCIAYFKNPKRELDSILPIAQLKTAKLYLRGC